MTKRKRCTICGRLFAPQGIARHTAFCIKKHHGAQGPSPSSGDVDMTGRTHVEGLKQTFDDILDAGTETGRIELVDPNTFESIVKELKDANLGLMVILLD